MALDTFSGLKTSIANFLNREDLTSVIPDFITLAEAQINRRLVKEGPVREMLTMVAFPVDAEFENVPADFHAAKAVFLAPNYLPLQFISPEEMVARKTAYPNASGDPQAFSVVGSQLQFWPWAAGTFADAELTYWAKVPALTDAAPTNWLLTNHPDIYLYTSLIQSAPYLSENARIQVWGVLASTALDDLIGADKVSRTAPHLGVGIVSGGTP